MTNTTWWPCASRLAMTLNRSGCDVAAVCPSRGHPLLKTSSVQTAFCYSPFDPLRSLAAAIATHHPDLVIPCDDRAVQHLHELYAAGDHAFGADFSALLEHSLGSPASYPVVANRLRLLEIAREEGLLLPETRAIRSLADLESLPSGEPWVLKSDGSWGGHGVRLANDRKQLRQSWEQLMKPLSAARAVKRLVLDRDPFWLRTWWKHTQPNVIAQAYVPGRPANCAVYCRNGRVLAAVYVEVAQSRGATGSATVVRLVHHEEMQLAAERIACRLGLSGFFGLDFMLEKETGAAFLIEMNPRCTPLCHLQLGPGKDPVGALAAQLTGTSFVETAPVTRQETIAYFPQAWHWDPADRLLASSFQDVPWEEPALVQELLRVPFPDRGILARVSNRMRGVKVAGTSLSAVAPSVVPLRHFGEGEPLFLIHGVDGTVSRFHKLVKHLDPRWKIYGIQAQALLGDEIALTRVEDLASYYLKEVRDVQPHGPYHFLGYSFGGLIAFEMARQVHRWGEQVGMVGLIDNRPMNLPATLPISAHLTQGFRHAKTKLRARGLRYAYSLFDAISHRAPASPRQAADLNWFAARHYAPRFYPGPITLFQAAGGGDLSEQWMQRSAKGSEVREIPGGHEDLFYEPQVRFLAREISRSLSRFCPRIERSLPEVRPVSNEVMVH